jgi:hypothetical protein
MQTVIETAAFLRQAEKQGMTEAERSDLVEFIAANPEAGDVIKHSGGCRKVRFAGKGKGKSGGFRVITFYAGVEIPVFLLTVYAKGNLGNLTDAQVNTLKVLTKTLEKEYQR